MAHKQSAPSRRATHPFPHHKVLLRPHPQDSSPGLVFMPRCAACHASASWPGCFQATLHQQRSVDIEHCRATLAQSPRAPAPPDFDARQANRLPARAPLRPAGAMATNTFCVPAHAPQACFTNRATGPKPLGRATRWHKDNCRVFCSQITPTPTLCLGRLLQSSNVPSLGTPILWVQPFSPSRCFPY